MSSTIKLKRTANTGYTPDSNVIHLGELFLNYTDGQLFFTDANGRLYYLQATHVGYSFQTVNVNGQVIVASQGNTVLGIANDQTILLNVSGNTINIAANVPAIVAPVYAQANAAYAQANSAFDAANNAANTASAALNLANGALVVWNANATIDVSNVGRLLYHNTASVISVSLPTNANAAISLGDVFTVITGSGSGNTVIVPLAGVTLRTANSTLSGNCNVAANIVARVRKTELNIWYVDRS